MSNPYPVHTLEGVMPFGQYKGKNIKAVIEKNPEYVAHVQNRFGLKLDKEAKAHLKAMIQVAEDNLEVEDPGDDMYWAGKDCL